jgi:hypothetical protein
VCLSDNSVDFLFGRAALKEFQVARLVGRSMLWRGASMVREVVDVDNRKVRG